MFRSQPHIHAGEEIREALAELLRAAEDEVALKENTRFGGAEFWAAQTDDVEYQVPGVQRRVQLARAVIRARAALSSDEQEKQTEHEGSK